MPCHKKPCANTYSNYGSYLRTRGCESAICKILEDIKSGLIPIGPINPSVPCNLTINSNVTIQPCLEEPFSGQLIVNGGYVTPCSSDTTPIIQSIEAKKYSITAGNGLYVEGPIFADASLFCSYNTFIANNTLFTGNLDNTDPHNVTISGSSIIGSAITTDDETILTCGNDTLFNVNFADVVGTTILNINDNFNVNFASASGELILDIDSKKLTVYKSNSIPNIFGNEEPILRINKNCTVYNSLSQIPTIISPGERKIFEVICNLNATVIGTNMPGFVVKESNVDYANNSNIYMHHLPAVESGDVYPRVVVHPVTGRLYKDDTYTMNRLTVNDTATIGTLSVAADNFNVKTVNNVLDITMDNLSSVDISGTHHVLVVNRNNKVEKVSQDSLFTSLLAKIAALETRISNLEHSC